MDDLSGNVLNKRNIIRLVIFFVILLSVLLGIYLVKQRQIFRPKASELAPNLLTVSNDPNQTVAHGMVNGTISDTPAQYGDTFGPGTYRLSGVVSSTVILPGNASIAKFQADEWDITDPAHPRFVVTHGIDPNNTFFIPDSHFIVVLNRTSNANATYSPVLNYYGDGGSHLFGYISQNNLIGEGNFGGDFQNLTVSTADASSQKVSWILGDKAVGTFRITGDPGTTQGPNGPIQNGSIRVDVYRSDGRGGLTGVGSYKEGSIFTVPDNTYQFAVILHLDSGASTTFGRVILRQMDSAPGRETNALVGDDIMQHLRVGYAMTNYMQHFAGPGLFNLSGTITSTPVINTGNPLETQADIQGDEWVDGCRDLSCYTYHPANGPDFFVPSGSTLFVIIRAINANATYSNVSLINPVPTPTLVPASSPTPTPTNAPPATPSPALIPGDANHDMCVNALDYKLWINEFSGVKGVNPPTASYQGYCAKFAGGSSGAAGKPNALDYKVWAQNQGKPQYSAPNCITPPADGCGNI